MWKVSEERDDQTPGTVWCVWCVFLDLDLGVGRDSRFVVEVFSVCRSRLVCQRNVEIETFINNEISKSCIRGLLKDILQNLNFPSSDEKRTLSRNQI